MPTNCCVACGRPFEPRPQIRNQKFCSEPNCQRERRRRKQAEKRANNPVRRDVDAQYFRDWAAKNPGYWKKYRVGHPEYAERNRNQQRQRNRARKKDVIAKDDVQTSEPLFCGVYQLKAVSGNSIANDDVWIVEITVLSGPPGFLGGYCKVKP
jgi:hypothetical protein